MRSLVLLLLALVATASWAQDLQTPGEVPEDLTDLELEELMALDVFAVDVLGARIRLPGQWGVRYRFSLENGEGYVDGGNVETSCEADSGMLGSETSCEVLPTSLTAETHEAEILYTPRGDLTLTAAFPYVRRSMDHVFMDGDETTRFNTSSEGLGDVRLGADYTLFGEIGARHRLLINVALSFPTGSIDEEDVQLREPVENEQGPQAETRKLPYPMQLGSGTLDFVPGLTYLGQFERWALLAAAATTIRLRENSDDYRLGNEFRAAAWAARKLAEWVSLSGRIDSRFRGNVSGADQELEREKQRNPIADPRRQGGQRIDVLFGVNFYVPRGFLKGHRLEIEGGLPVYQSLDGPQLETDWLLSVSWGWDFYL